MSETTPTPREVLEAMLPGTKWQWPHNKPDRFFVKLENGNHQWVDGSEMVVDQFNCYGQPVIISTPPPAPAPTLAELVAADQRDLRWMFDRTVKLAASYGDNLFHCKGEQADRQFEKLMSELMTAVAAEMKADPPAPAGDAAPPAERPANPYSITFDGVTFDLYRLADELPLMSHSQFHALKKIAFAGGRCGGKSRLRDLEEARRSLDAAIDAARRADAAE